MTLDWNTDYWAFKAPHVHAPAPQARVPKPVPEPDRLFTIQRHALDMMHTIREIDARNNDPHVARLIQHLEQKAENTYKVINRYLKDNVAPSQGGGPTSL